MLDNGEVTNKQRVEEDFARALAYATRMTAGRLAQAKEITPVRRYNPVGYVLAADKDREDERLQRRREPSEARRDRLAAEAQQRLIAAAK